MHDVAPHQRMRILTIQIAVAADAILDRRCLTEYQPTVTASDDPDEGELFGLPDFKLTITEKE